MAIHSYVDWTKCEQTKMCGVQCIRMSGQFCSVHFMIPSEMRYIQCMLILHVTYYDLSCVEVTLQLHL